MHPPDNEQLEKLEVDARSIEDALVTHARAWARDQGSFTRQFLLQEARLTVINQAEVTDTVVDEVPALKAEVEEICDELAATFEEWSASVDLQKAKTLAQNPRNTFLKLTAQSHEAFGNVFIRRRYNSGSGSRDRTSGSPNWHFYIPETGTARNPAMRYDASAAKDLSDLWSSWAAIARQINSAKDQIQRSRAARLWDADLVLPSP
ncbi:hypothetical protein [Pseudarthrobacter oxydans]|uniref:hypothetical protein n=1 Tax=Pseudarthrobacter oxydans TaxID=1671 RepID=UPI0037FCEFC5